jgi:hypothetical protein
MSSNRPHAKISENRLVFSLPDAMTPVVWVMDLKDEGTFILRVEQNDAGLYILQKISRDGKKIEDIAYYAQEKKAKKSMVILTEAIGKNKVNNPLSRAWGIFKTLLFVAGILAILYIIIALNFNRILNFIGGEPESVAVQQSRDQQEPLVSSDPNAVGVPMSADDFFDTPQNFLPF